MAKFLWMEDKEIGYPVDFNTGEPLKDAIFKFVVSRYKKNNHSWKFSDQKIFHGFIYGITSYFGAMIFFVLIGWILFQTQKLYGFEKALLLGLLMILFRINILIKQIVKLNRNF